MRYLTKTRNRNFFMVILALLLVIPGLTYADTGGETKKENSLQPGSWALQFQLEQEFSLEPFDNLILAMKKHRLKSPGRDSTHPADTRNT